MKRVLPFLLIVSLCAPAYAAPNPQLAQSVSSRLQFYGIRVPADSLTTAQAAALHLLMSSGKRYLEVRGRARAILRNPDFTD